MKIENVVYHSLANTSKAVNMYSEDEDEQIKTYDNDEKHNDETECAKIYLKSIPNGS